MSMYNVREAYQVLKERGIARDKQEVRRWLNEGYIQADPPMNRRIGWKIEVEALQSFIQRFENGEFEELRYRRRNEVMLQLKSVKGHVPSENRSQFIRLEEEVAELRQQLRGLRRELNDLKKVLGFPILAPGPAAMKEDTQS
jgi:translation elongation factor EF-Ts